MLSDEERVAELAEVINAALHSPDLPFPPDLSKDQRWYRERCYGAARAVFASLLPPGHTILPAAEVAELRAIADEIATADRLRFSWADELRAIADRLER